MYLEGIYIVLYVLLYICVYVYLYLYNLNFFLLQSEPGEQQKSTLARLWFLPCCFRCFCLIRLADKSFLGFIQYLVSLGGNLYNLFNPSSFTNIDIYSITVCLWSKTSNNHQCSGSYNYSYSNHSFLAREATLSDNFNKSSPPLRPLM